MHSNLIQLKQSGALRDLDLQLAMLLSEFEPDQDILLAAALTSAELGRGHVCLPLSRLPKLLEGKGLTTELSQQQWLERCQNSAIIGEGKPLYLKQDRLYLQRYWQYEKSVAARLIAMSQSLAVDNQWLQQALKGLFAEGEALDWQQVAIVVALCHRFAVISGGPGTGKTTTVTKLLALLQSHSLKQGKPLRIALAAPTGKAAARLSESIAGSKAQLQLDESILPHIPAEAGTLHRLLGVIPNSMKFRHHQQNPLHLDLLVVDEASMIDLPMMARLLDALPPHARLILLGDREQLASVEAGSVLADICSFIDAGYSEPFAAQLSTLFGAFTPGSASSPLQDGLALLRKSYRFREDSGIGKLAGMVRDNHRVALAEFDAFSDLKLQALNEASYQTAIQDVARHYSVYLEHLAAADSEAQIREALQAFNLTRMLCAHREGNFGVTGLNQRIERQLSKLGRLTPDGLWYHGRPVMIRENQHGLGLYNGDIGITHRGEDGLLKVWFVMSDNSLQSFIPSRLPKCETAFAMTIHKSQGSEFHAPVLILPPNWSPVVSRELVYTGITRAREHLQLVAEPAVLNKAIASPTQRSSGLAEMLRYGADGS